MPPHLLQIIGGGPAQTYRLGPATRAGSWPSAFWCDAAAIERLRKPRVVSLLCRRSAAQRLSQGLNTGLNYQWLRSQQFTFALTSLYYARRFAQPGSVAARPEASGCFSG